MPPLFVGSELPRMCAWMPRSCFTAFVLISSPFLSERCSEISLPRAERICRCQVLSSDVRAWTCGVRWCAVLPSRLAAGLGRQDRHVRPTHRKSHQLLYPVGIEIALLSVAHHVARQVFPQHSGWSHAHILGIVRGRSGPHRLCVQPHTPLPIRLAYPVRIAGQRCLPR